jgi:hypothetical protein
LEDNMRSNFTFHIDFDTDDGYIKSEPLKLKSSTPEINTFNPDNPEYSRAKWEEFLIYDITNELSHHLGEYVKAAVKSFLDAAEEHNKKPKKSKKK